MAFGFVPYLLTHLKKLAQENYQGLKITPSGFTQMLLENSPKLQVTDINGVAVPGQGPGIKLSTPGGHIRSLKVKYLPRILASQVQTTDTCDNDVMFTYSESDVTATLTRKLSFFVDWSRVELYESDASNAASMGNPAYATIMEVVEQLMHTVNGLITSVNTGLVGAVTWGANVGNSGLATAQSININQDSQVFDLNNGLIKIMRDMRRSEVIGEPILVGNGLIDAFMISRQGFGLAQSGINLTQLPAAGFKYYYDEQTATTWGANQVGAFARNNIGIVDIDRYIAWKTGRFGTSHFATIALPVVTPAGTTTMTFNLQVIEQDCPQDSFPDGYTTSTVDRGYQIILSKRFGLWQMPGTTVQGTDRLAGVNGAFRFTLTNECEPCPA